MPNVNNVEQSGATEQRNDGWISVKDRLPDEDTTKTVLAWNKSRGPVIRFYVAGDWFNEYQQSTMNYKSEIESITHWQPLPPPPKTD